MSKPSEDVNEMNEMPYPLWCRQHHRRNHYRTQALLAPPSSNRPSSEDRRSSSRSMVFVRAKLSNRDTANIESSCAAAIRSISALGIGDSSDAPAAVNKEQAAVTVVKILCCQRASRQQPKTAMMISSALILDWQNAHRCRKHHALRL